MVIPRFANISGSNMPFAERGARKIHYRIDGNGETTLLFANSLGQPLQMWNKQVEALGGHFRILRFDYPGHGLSPSIGAEESVGRLADDALAVLDAAGAGRVHFVGLSLGGMIGQHLAVKAPEKLQSLMLCATAACLPPSEGWEQRARTALAEGMEPFVEISRDRWFTPSFLDTGHEDVMFALAALRAVDASGYAACCRAIRDFDLRGSINLIRLPVQLLAGDQDPSTPPELLRAIHERIPGSRYETLPGAAHLLNVEQPSRTIELIHRCCQINSN